MLELCELTTLLNHAQQYIARESEEALKEHGLSLAKYNILDALAESGGRLPFSVLVERLGCVRVELKTDGMNAVSRAAILRLGAKEEGTLRRQLRRADGSYRDTVYFSILDSEWPAVRARLTDKLATR